MVLNDPSNAIHAYPTPDATPPLDHVSDTIVLVSSRAVISDEHDSLTMSPVTITISTLTGRITSILPTVLPPSSFPANTPYTDHSPHLLIPGLVDAHVHLNEPGRTEWEGFWTGTRAAASGGVTTVIDMPLNAIPPTTTLHGLREKVAAAQGKCWVDVGFYGGIIPGNASQLLSLVEAGVRGFKGFLIESGVDEFPAVSAPDIELAMRELKDVPTTLMFHAEMIPPITKSVGDEVQVSPLPPLVPDGPLNSYHTFLASRPSSFETCAIEEILSLAHLAPSLQLHIVHLSAIEAIPLLREARAKGVKISAETCPHYLSLAAEQVKEGDTRHKCCPPIRSESNRLKLWEELGREDSVISTVVSDHSPCTPELKLLPGHVVGAKERANFEGISNSVNLNRCGGKAKNEDGTNHVISDEEVKEKGDFFKAWGGVSSVGLALPILWTEVGRQNQELFQSSPIDITDVVRWTCVNTAKQVGLQQRKGALKVGMDADIAVFDDKGTFVVERGGMLWRNKVSPYAGKELRGVVRETWVRGRRVFARSGVAGGEKRDMEGFAAKPSGELLLEKRTI